MENNTTINFDLNELQTKYKNNPHIMSRLATVLNNLPHTLETENKKYEERIQRNSELKIEQDNFFFFTLI